MDSTVNSPLREVVECMKNIYGDKLRKVILYGSYALAVKEKNLLLAFRIPNITSWKNDWEFVNLTTEANTSSLQSEVKFKLD